MNSVQEQLLLLITTPVYFIVIGLEILLSNYHKSGHYTLKDTATNIYLMAVNSTIELLFRGIYITVILTFCYENRFFDLRTGWIYWIMLVVLEDFMYYWLHRVDHYCRFFWATHVTHHSSEKFNLTVGFRSSVMEPFYRFVYFTPIAFCGFHPLDIAFIYSATQIWGILVHTERVKNMGWLEYIFVTPSHHRVHHASNPKYLDKNMGMLLIFWDKLFGTFQKELPESEYAPIRYGLTTPLDKTTPVNLIFHEWSSVWRDIRRDDLTWKQKMGYLFGPPGWSHDGSRLTSEELREIEAAGQRGE
ncbi:MAG: sterol desaturase family protein [Gemmatimonadaceae bacterium]|nr:sterol desaturase family protein [Chitinophagaceae bacterium]